MSHLTQVFTEIGGEFIIPEASLIEKMKHIKAFVFDWDGVFTDAGKDHLLQSRFSEADSMGTNLLRFSYYLNHKELPITAIISGEKNSAAFTFVDRDSHSPRAARLIEDLDKSPWSLFLIDEAKDRYYGPDAIPMILKNLPFGKFACVFYILPGTMWLTRNLYVLISGFRQIFDKPRATA